jgi:lipopolysaccharide transport system permease protein
MYATPVVYPLSYLKDKSFRWIVDINPLTAVMEAFRFALFQKGTVETNAVIYSLLFTVVALFGGIVLFNRVEKTFMDTV